MASNGNLPPSSLTKVDGWAYLSPPTAAAWVGFCNEMESRGYPRPTVTAPDGAYRTLAQQHYWKAYWTGRGKPGNAATPGWSNHGWGTAIDIFNVYRYPRNVIVPVAAKYGFTFNVPSELWHIQHNGTWPAGGGTTPIEKEEDMTPEQDALLKQIATQQRPIRELVQTPDGTVWYCYERLFRYGIRREDALKRYQEHLKNLGHSADIVRVSATQVEGWGVPVFADQNDRIAAQTAKAVVAALPKTGAELTAAQVEAAVKSAMENVEVTATVDAQAIAKAVNEDAANRLRD